MSEECEALGPKEAWGRGQAGEEGLEGGQVLVLGCVRIKECLKSGFGRGRKEGGGGGGEEGGRDDDVLALLMTALASMPNPHPNPTTTLILHTQ